MGNIDHTGEPEGLEQTIPGNMHTVTGSGLDVPGVEGTSTRNNGVFGKSDSKTASGVYGENNGAGYGIAGRSMQPGGVGIYGQGPIAGKFDGDVVVSGDIKLENADCAEDFDISGSAEVLAGTVMVLDDHGALQPIHKAYDKRVAGVVSGAGTLRPGIVLDRHETDAHRLPIALLGKVYCMIDATFAPVEIGDLLTSSPTTGHAMKAADQSQAFGAVIGKALGRIREGRGLVPILVALQ